MNSLYFEIFMAFAWRYIFIFFVGKFVKDPFRFFTLQEDFFPFKIKHIPFILIYSPTKWCVLQKGKNKLTLTIYFRASAKFLFFN